MAGIPSWVFYVIAGSFALFWLVKLIEWIDAQRRTLKAKEKDLATREAKVAEQVTLIREGRDALDILAEEKALGFPWLAAAFAEHLKLLDVKLANELATKKHPALRAAEEVRRLAQEKSLLRKENKILRELHAYYEALFPWLIDFKGTDLDEVIYQLQDPVDRDEDADQDPAFVWMTDAEVSSTSLTKAEKYQRALDRYWKSRKTPWQIGRDYERYVGYLHETEGFRVDYFGATAGLEDLGRDLICRKEDEVRIIQCKYWSYQKTLHEKHVCQIFGSAAMFQLRARHDDPGMSHKQRVSSWLYTSCSCSDVAKDFAKVLGVSIIEQFPLGNYPVIKCHVSKKTGEKIYHLPFDQQYDRTILDRESETYVATVAEAEKLGFRRAYRWRGDSVCSRTDLGET